MPVSSCKYAIISFSLGQLRMYAKGNVWDCILQCSCFLGFLHIPVGVGISGPPLSPAAPSPIAAGGGGANVNVVAISGGSIAAVVVVVIAAGVPVLVWLIRRHRGVTISLQEGNK